MDHDKSPSRKVGENDNRGSHFYMAKLWANKLATQNEDLDLKKYFSPIAEELSTKELEIVDQLLSAQGKMVDIGGYYHASQDKISAAMRPSSTLNQIID